MLSQKYKALKKYIARKTRAYRSPKQQSTAHNFNPLLPHRLALHTGEGKMALSHINLWEPVFSTSNIPYVVITRNITAYNSIIEKFPTLTVVLARSAKEVNSLLGKIPTLKACFYPSNTGNNIHLINHSDITHVFIGHGDSDKSASAHKFFRVYDQNWVAGDAHHDRFINAGFNFPNLKFTKVGRPSLKPILESSDSHWEKRLPKNRILILPTWEGVYEEQDYSSLTILQETINLLSSETDIEISIKLHPATGSRDKKLKKFLQVNKNCTLVSADTPIPKLLLENNLFICDISAVVSEVLACNCPIFLYKPENKSLKFSKSNMPYESYCYIHHTPEQLVSNLTEVVNGSDKLIEARNQAQEYILGSKETLVDNFHNQLHLITEQK